MSLRITLLAPGSQVLAAPALKGGALRPLGLPHHLSGPAVSPGEARAHCLLSSPAPNSTAKFGQKAHKLLPNYSLSAEMSLVAVLREDKGNAPLHWAIRDLPALKGEASNWG
ncbi:hypothetical protein SE86_04140 [Acidilobus sp. 7A]|nr:hypothetical protein SE86_04140 [Acidilobus sp. 7A]